MAEGPNYEVPLKRRREESTDYGKRMEFLKSGEPRAVVRLSNNHTRLQVVEYDGSGDSTLASAFTGELEDYGWNGHPGNLTAAYLSGYLAGRRALDNGIEVAVPDLGSRKREHGSRHYAALQGLKDSGVKVSLNDTVSPDPERIEGEHLQDPPDSFEEVKKSIDADYGDG